MQVDSARANLASTFVNAFVNAGYGQDALITPEGNAWLYKNKVSDAIDAMEPGIRFLWYGNVQYLRPLSLMV